MTPHLRKVGLAIVALSLVAICFATLTPQTSTSRLPHYCLICGSYGTVDALLNVLLFLPLGLGLAMCGLPPMLAGLTAFLLSGGIELTQLTAIPGRDATIGDVVFNTLGALCGFAIGISRSSLLRPRPVVALRLALAWSLLWMSLQAATNYAFRIALPESVYYGQIAHKLGGFAVFNGSVERISVDGLPIIDGKIPDSDSLRGALLRGQSLTATIVPKGMTPAIAPIVRIADGTQEEVLLLGQLGPDLVYTVRAGATSLRVRRPFFVLDDALDSQRSQTPNDSVLTTAHYAGGQVLLESARSSGRKSVHLHPSASYGWVLLLPFQWFIAGSATERVIGLVWSFCLLFPLGYWMVASTQASPKMWSSVRLRAVGVFLWLLIGLAVLPALIGAHSADVTEWTGALASLILGGAAAWRLRRAEAS